MALASLILGLLSFVFMIAGLFTSMIPFVGGALSFGAPVVGLFGLVLGGVALSRATREGDSSGMATAGMVVSGICFVLSLVFALTCGMCNACMSTAAVQDPNSPFNPNYTPPAYTQQPTNPQPFPTTPPPTPPPITPTLTPTTPPSTAPPATTACEHAFDCCMAFADDDESFCEGAMANADSEACEHMMQGWSQGLRAMGQDTAVCAP